MWKNQKDRYGTAMIALHWLTLILILLTYLFINLHDQALKGSAFRAQMKHWHFVFGLLVIPTVLVRLSVKAFAGPKPEIKPHVNRWLLWGGETLHFVLYALLLALPLLGWITLSAGGKTIPFHLPPITAEHVEAAKSYKSVHKFLGNLSYYLIGFHAAATLFHHYVLRDTVLVRMLPWRKD